jgi:hypothetical protein
MQVPSDSGPRVAVEPVALRPGDGADEWRVTWRIADLGDEPLTLLAAWQPHGRFRAAEQPLDPPPRLEPGEATRLLLTVVCAGTPGEVVENAFLILRVHWGDASWRVLTRLTLRFGDDRVPTIVPEAITTQPIGFAADV